MAKPDAYAPSSVVSNRAQFTRRHHSSGPSVVTSDSICDDGDALNMSNTDPQDDSTSSMSLLLLATHGMAKVRNSHHSAHTALTISQTQQSPNSANDDAYANTQALDLLSCIAASSGESQSRQRERQQSQERGTRSAHSCTDQPDKNHPADESDNPGHLARAIFTPMLLKRPAVLSVSTESVKVSVKHARLEQPNANITPDIAAPHAADMAAEALAEISHDSDASLPRASPRLDTSSDTIGVKLEEGCRDLPDQISVSILGLSEIVRNMAEEISASRRRYSDLLEHWFSGAMQRSHGCMASYSADYALLRSMVGHGVFPVDAFDHIMRSMETHLMRAQNELVDFLSYLETSDCDELEHSKQAMQTLVNVAASRQSSTAEMKQIVLAHVVRIDDAYMIVLGTKIDLPHYAIAESA